MAIDDAEKRKSAAGIPFIPMGPNVTPNSSQDVQWRQQVAWSYSGIAPISTAAFTPRLPLLGVG